MDSMPGSSLETETSPSSSSRLSLVKAIAYPSGPRERQGVAERFRHMWKLGLYTDLVIQTKNHAEKVHLSYLVTWSERLCEQLNNQQTGESSSVISFPQLERDGVSPLMDFIYNGLLKLSYQNFCLVLHSSICLDVIPAVKNCLRFVEENHLHPGLISDIIKNVDEYAFCKADTLVKTFLKKHINSTVLVSNFVTLKGAFLHELFESTTCNDRREIDVFRALMVWLHVNKPSLTTKKQLLSLLRFDNMSAGDLDIVITSPPYLMDGCESVFLRAINHRLPSYKKFYS